MVQNHTPNYPDILGYVTDGKRITIANVVEVALAVHPPVARAGRPFRVIAMMQNSTDVNVQVTAALHLPKKDSQKAENRFFARNDQLNFVLHPAETGYLVLPVSSQPDTAPGDYRMEVSFDVNPLGKPQRVRGNPEEEEGVNLNYYFSLTEKSLAALSSLKGLSFEGEKRGRFSNRLGTSVRIGPGKGIKPLRSSPEWISLWSLATDTDVRPLLERHHNILREKVLPQLSVMRLYQPLYNAVRDRINLAGYPIRDVEVHYITKLMVSVLEMSRQNASQETYPGENMYRVADLINRGWPTNGKPIPLPMWCNKLLYTIGFDDRVLDDPIEALTRPLFDDLMRDALLHGFSLLHVATQVDLGDDDDIRAYTDRIIGALWEPDITLDFVDVHMPLVLGGLLADDTVKMATEDRATYYYELLDMYETRQAEYDEDTSLFFDLALYLVDAALQKHGFWTA